MQLMHTQKTILYSFRKDMAYHFSEITNITTKHYEHNLFVPSIIRDIWCLEKTDSLHVVQITANLNQIK